MSCRLVHSPRTVPDQVISNLSIFIAVKIIHKALGSLSGIFPKPDRAAVSGADTAKAVAAGHINARQHYEGMQLLAIDGATGMLPHLKEEFGATVIPPAVWVDASGTHDLTSGRPRLTGGVRVGGRNVRSSAHYETAVELMSVELAEDVSPEENLAGRWLYFGLAVQHFGHFLMESLGRTWALDEPALGKIDGIIFLMHPDIQGGLPEINKNLLDLVTGLPVKIITVPTLVECIVIPRQESLSGIGMLSTPRHIAALRRRFHHGVSDAHEVIYLSRAGIKDCASTGKILGGEELEARMQSCGVKVVRPETLSIDQQLEIYRGARVVIAEEGSALHLLAMSAQPDVTVIVIARRPWMTLLIEAHLTLFLGDRARICLIDPPGVRLGLPGDPYRAWLSVDAPSLQSCLAAIDPVFAKPNWEPVSKQITAQEENEVSELFSGGINRLQTLFT
ncbi:glycosyltransferase family 61 protein [Ottowia thiooxydans]|uniref:glycosyltransferase family 61 protein n=1 Tax=Ottowia thiooxydans TaxID=219182 RepID=UPI0003FE1B7D|nr:glycosyltransferase 61 family protein [Ottowia thiooxydans]